MPSRTLDARRAPKNTRKMAGSAAGLSFGRPRRWRSSVARVKLAAGLETRKYSSQFEKHLGNAGLAMSAWRGGM
jgi:hypothetical protein